MHDGVNLLLKAKLAHGLLRDYEPVLGRVHPLIALAVETYVVQLATLLSRYVISSNKRHPHFPSS